MKVLTFRSEITERYYVTDQALHGAPDDPAELESYLIDLFEAHHGSQFCDALFEDDANPQIGYFVEEIDDED